jgi:hypothetical protein
MPGYDNIMVRKGKTARKEGSPMKYILWKVTENTFEEVARFYYKDLADATCALASMFGDRYEVTPVNETPVW